MSAGNEGGGIPPLSASDELGVRLGHAAEQAIEDIEAACQWLAECEAMCQHKHGGMPDEDEESPGRLAGDLSAIRCRLIAWIDMERGS